MDFLPGSDLGFNHICFLRNVQIIAWVTQFLEMATSGSNTAVVCQLLTPKESPNWLNSSFHSATISRIRASAKHFCGAWKINARGEGHQKDSLLLDFLFYRPQMKLREGNARMYASYWNAVLFYFISIYRSGTVNSNTVNSKFHLIRSYWDIFFYHFPNISCLKSTVNSNFHLIRSKTLLRNDFELTVPNLYLNTIAKYSPHEPVCEVFDIHQLRKGWSQFRDIRARETDYVSCRRHDIRTTKSHLKVLSLKDETKLQLVLKLFEWRREIGTLWHSIETT